MSPGDLGVPNDRRLSQAEGVAKDLDHQTTSLLLSLSWFPQS